MVVTGTPVGGGGGTYTVADVLTKVRYEVGDEDANNYPNEELISYLNDAIELLWARLAARAPWFFDSTAYIDTEDYVILDGTADYALPSDFLLDRFLDLNGDQTFNLKATDQLVTGAEGYLLNEGNIKILPEPTADGTATLHYIPKFTRVTETTDTLQLYDDDVEFGQALTSFIALKCKMSNREGPSGSDALFNLMNTVVMTYAAQRNAPRDRGAKVTYHNYS